MKKLMIATAVAAIGFAAHSAEVVWSAWNYSTSGTAKTLYEAAAKDKDATIDATMYVIYGLGSASVNGHKEALITQLRALDSGWNSAITGNANYLGNFAYDTSKNAKPELGQANLTGGQLASGVDFLDTYSERAREYAYAVILTQDKAGNEWAYISGTANATGGEPGTISVGALTFNVGSTGVYDLDATQTGKQSGWYQLNTAAVPEPTSGLLLLLGMAGLALRRRRA